MPTINWGGGSSSGGGGSVAEPAGWDGPSVGGTFASSTGVAAEPGQIKTPGSFNVSVFSPGSAAAALDRDAQQANDLVAGLGEALFGEKTGFINALGPSGAALGGIVRGISALPVIDRISGNAVGIANAVGSIPTGWLSSMGIEQTFAGLPDSEAKRAVELAAGQDPFGGSALKHDYAKQVFEEQSLGQREPDLSTLYPDLAVPPPDTLAGFVGRLLAYFITPAQRAIERGAAGTAKITSGMNRLDEIEAIARGGVDIGIGGTGAFAGPQGLTPVEALTYEKWKSGEWTEDRALDYLASHGSGLSRDPGLEIAGTVATDPTVFLSGGLTLAARVAGRAVAAGEAGLRAGAVGSALAAARASRYGPALRVAHNIIDPLNAIARNLPSGKALVELYAAETTRVAKVSGFGVAATRRVDDAMEELGILDKFDNGFGTYTANLGREVVGEQEAIAASTRVGALEALAAGRTPAEVVAERVAAGVTRDLPQAIGEKMAQVKPLAFELTVDNIVRRMVSAFGGDADTYRAVVGKMDADELAYIHAATYGRAVRNLLDAVGRAAAAWTKTTPINRLVLLNEKTLTQRKARSISRELAAATTPEAKAAIIEEARETYFGTLGRGTAVDYNNLSASVARIERRIARLVDEGELATDFSAREIKGLPAEIRDFIATHPGWKIGFRPADEHLWRLEADAEGIYRTATPWVDHVAEATPAYRVGVVVPRNIAGMPLVGKVARTVAKPLDWLEAGRATLAHQVSGVAIRAAAHQRFVTRLVADVGATKNEAEHMINALERRAGLLNEGRSVRSLSETDMWLAITDIVPQRMRAAGFVKRDLLRAVLHAYEGDLRLVGLTQKFTGRMKRVLAETPGLGDELGGNFAGQFSEYFYQLLKFRYNLVFQVQERIEPWILNGMRGVMPYRGGALNARDVAMARTHERLLDSGLLRQADSLDMREYSSAAFGGNALREGLLAGPDAVPRLEAMRGTARVKRVNMLRQMYSNLGATMRGAFGEAQFLDIKRTMGLADDNAVALRWLDEQMTANLGVSLRKDGSLSYDNIIDTAEWHLPTDVGELRPLHLDAVARDFGLRDLAALRAEIASPARGTQTLDDILLGLADRGATPEYVARVKNALEFEWEPFWNEVQDKFNLSRVEATNLRQMFEETARLRRMTPVDYLSQVFSAHVGGLTADAMAEGVAVLRAGAKSTTDDLLHQITEAFHSHLDDSAKLRLMEESGIVSATAPAGAGTRVPFGRTSVLPAVDDPGYVYHVTDAAEDIRMEGLQPHEPSFRGEQDFWPDGSDQPRSYWTSTAKGTELFGPDAGPRNAVLRVKQDARFATERGTGDIIATETIPPQEVEYFGGDGQWHPLADDSAAPPSATWTAAHTDWLTDQMRAYMKEGGPRSTVLTVEEQAALDSYAARTFRYMNDELRGGALPRDPSVRAMVEHLDSAIAKSDVPAGTTLYRGTSIAEFGIEEPRVGQVVTNPGYLSTTTEESTARVFAVDPTGGNVVLHIETPEGVRGARITDGGFGGEEEFLLPRGTSLRITKVEKTGLEEESFYRIEAEIVAPPAPTRSVNTTRSLQYMGQWSESALGRTLGVPTDHAAAFDVTQQMVYDAIILRMRGFEDDAFRVHYFKRTRSVLERSVNHPFFGLYPASYMWGKILPEMLRFMAKEPFGLPTGALAYAANDVYEAVAMQRELDAEFDTLIERLGHSPTVRLIEYMVPSTPWNVGAGAPAWLRNLAEQGIANKRRIAAGLEPRNIDPAAPIEKTADYLNTIQRTLDAFGNPLGEIANAALGSPREQAAQGGMKTFPFVGPYPSQVPGPVSGPTPAEQLAPTLQGEFEQLYELFSAP